MRYMGEKNILYIGGFELPDKNAAAHRVVSIARMLRELGFYVVFLNRTTDNTFNGEQKNYYGFKCIEIKKHLNKISRLKELFDISYVVHWLNTNEDIWAIIAYNYPAIALNRLRGICKKRGILCIADVTEWYGVMDRSLVYKFTKSLDIAFRMKYVHKKIDGVIVISSYLEEYYKSFLPVVKIPPLVDTNDLKWTFKDIKKHKGIRFVYAGTPSREKEKLDSMIKSIEYLSRKYDVYLDIVGISKEQFINIYNYNRPIKNVSFHGRLSHVDTIKLVAKDDYSIIIRDENRVTIAGFPTKFVESITCGTKVVANSVGDLTDYLKTGDLGFLVHSTNIKDITSILEIAIRNKGKKIVNKKIFDYRCYINIFACFVETMSQKRRGIK